MGRLDCNLIEVTTWAGLTVTWNIHNSYNLHDWKPNALGWTDIKCIINLFLLLCEENFTQQKTKHERMETRKVQTMPCRNNKSKRNNEMFGIKDHSGIPCPLWEQDKSPPDKNPPNNEIIIQSYYICFILMVILKDISKN